MADAGGSTAKRWTISEALLIALLSAGVAIFSTLLTLYVSGDREEEARLNVQRLEAAVGYLGVLDELLPDMTTGNFEPNPEEVSALSGKLTAAYLRAKLLLRPQTLEVTDRVQAAANQYLEVLAIGDQEFGRPAVYYTGPLIEARESFISAVREDLGLPD